MKYNIRISWHIYAGTERIRDMAFTKYWSGGNSRSYCLVVTVSQDSADEMAWHPRHYFDRGTY